MSRGAIASSASRSWEKLMPAASVAGACERSSSPRVRVRVRVRVRARVRARARVRVRVRARPAAGGAPGQPTPSLTT